MQQVACSQLGQAAHQPSHSSLLANALEAGSSVGRCQRGPRCCCCAATGCLAGPPAHCQLQCQLLGGSCRTACAAPLAAAASEQVLQHKVVTEQRPGPVPLMLKSLQLQAAQSGKRQDLKPARETKVQHVVKPFKAPHTADRKPSPARSAMLGAEASGAHTPVTACCESEPRHRYHPAH